MTTAQQRAASQSSFGGVYFQARRIGAESPGASLLLYLAMSTLFLWSVLIIVGDLDPFASSSALHGSNSLPRDSSSASSPPGIASLAEGRPSTPRNRQWPRDLPLSRASSNQRYLRFVPTNHDIHCSLFLFACRPLYRRGMARCRNPVLLVEKWISKKLPSKSSEGPALRRLPTLRRPFPSQFA